MRRSTLLPFHSCLLPQERLAIGTSGGLFHDDADDGVGTVSSLMPKDDRRTNELVDRQAHSPWRKFAGGKHAVPFQVSFLLGAAPVARIIVSYLVLLLPAYSREAKMYFTSITPHKKTFRPLR